MTTDIQKVILADSVTLGDAFARLNEGIGGAIVLVNETDQVTGMLTEGDLRRAILGGATLEDPVAPVMNRSFRSAAQGVKREDVLRQMDGAIRHIPVLDPDGKLVELVSWSYMWRLPISEPTLGGNELKYVADCIKTMWISSQGSYVTQFEQALAGFCEAEQAVATTSGTTALHLALAGLGVGPGDEVIVPAVTFGASANAVIHTGATPVFADIHPETKTLDPTSVCEVITDRTKALMPVHLYGHPCDMDPLMEIARDRKLKVVEDCAEALGASYKGRPIGSFGDAAAFSFFANKIITTGEGGMVLTQSEQLAERMRLLRDHGMDPNRKYWHLEPGFNFRLTNIQAAIGLAQMEQINRFLENRLEVAAAYESRLSASELIELPPNESWARNVYWLYTICLKGRDRDAVMAALQRRGVDCRVVFPPLPGQPAFGAAAPPGSFPNAENFGNQGLSLPLSNATSVEDALRVAQYLIDVLDAG